jgi:hypothetical protein
MTSIERPLKREQRLEWIVIVGDHGSPIEGAANTNT